MAEPDPAAPCDQDRLEPGAVAMAEPGLAPYSLRTGLREAGPIAIAGLLANGANVVVTVLMARLLSVRGYGALAQLTGLFLIVSMPGAAVVVGVVRRVAERRDVDGPGEVWAWARRTHRMAAAGVLLFAIVVFLLRGEVAAVLSLPDMDGVFAILTAGAVYVLLSIDRGLLQGHREYRTLAANLVVEGGVRSVGMIVLVAAGFGVAGAAWGVLVAELVTMVHARFVADRIWSAEARASVQVEIQAPVQAETHAPIEAGASARAVAGSSRAAPDAGGPPLVTRPRRARRATAAHRALLYDVAAALVAMALLAYLQNVDVLIFGREAPHRSGSYAAISVACKVLVFGATALGAYLLPEAALRWRAGGHALRQVGITLLLLSVPAVVLLVISVACPGLLLSVVFSAKYLGAEDAFAPLLVAMVCLSVTVVLTMYLLAVGRRWISALLFAGAAVVTGAIAWAHGDPLATAVADLVVQAALATCVLGVFVHVHRDRVALRTVAARATSLLVMRPRQMPQSLAAERP